MADQAQYNHFLASPFEPVYGYYRAARAGSRVDAAADLVGHAHGAVFKYIRPAATMPVVPALIRPGRKVEIEAEAILER